MSPPGKCQKNYSGMKLNSKPSKRSKHDSYTFTMCV